MIFESHNSGNDALKTAGFSVITLPLTHTVRKRNNSPSKIILSCSLTISFLASRKAEAAASYSFGHQLGHISAPTALLHTICIRRKSRRNSQPHRGRCRMQPARRKCILCGARPNHPQPRCSLRSHLPTYLVRVFSVLEMSNRHTMIQLFESRATQGHESQQYQRWIISYREPVILRGLRNIHLALLRSLRRISRSVIFMDVEVILNIDRLIVLKVILS